MRYNLLYHWLAVEDIEQSINYYENLEKGLGRKFALTLKELLDLIGCNPKIFKERKNGFRKATTQKFGYEVVFKIFDDEILVCYVSHHKTNPDTWNMRKDEL